MDARRREPTEYDRQVVAALPPLDRDRAIKVAALFLGARTAAAAKAAS
jgi:hypothetical protein